MPRRVLIADDSGAMRKIILRALGAIGISDITEADDGDAVIEQLKSGAFDLVLIDWTMPGMSGTELITAIRRKNADLPIIVIMTEAELAQSETALEAGANDFLAKPFEPETLKLKINQFALA